MSIRRAERGDLSRVAEIYVFNNRINFFPIFGDEEYSFKTLQVESIINDFFSREEIMRNLYVFEDTVIRGFILVDGTEIVKLFVDPFFQSGGYGVSLIEFAIERFGADNLWALEKNTRALAFYAKHGFKPNGVKKFEEDTTEYLVQLVRS